MIHIDDMDVRAFHRGDDRAMNLLFIAYHKQLYIYAYRLLNNQHDAQDVTARALAEVWNNRASMRDALHIERYLYTVTKNFSIDILRRKERYRHYSIDMTDENWQLESDTPTMYDRLDATVQAAWIEKIQLEVENLPLQQKKVIQLLLKSKPISFIAHHLKISIKSVYAHKYGAIKKLKQSLSIDYKSNLKRQVHDQ